MMAPSCSPVSRMGAFIGSANISVVSAREKPRPDFWEAVGALHIREMLSDGFEMVPTWPTYPSAVSKA
jgi:hypothetical protein